LAFQRKLSTFGILLLNFSKLYSSSCIPYLGALHLRRAHSHGVYSNSVNESKEGKEKNRRMKVKKGNEKNRSRSWM
jgi:hypothetical protein